LEGSTPNKQESDTIVIRNVRSNGNLEVETGLHLKWFQLPPSVTWQALRDKFREFGDVKFAEIRNKDTGFVRFSSQREAVRATSKHSLLNKFVKEGLLTQNRPIDFALCWVIRMKKSD